MVQLKERSRVYDLLLILVGAIISLSGTTLTELWLIPAKQQRGIIKRCGKSEEGGVPFQLGEKRR